jgi:hypothetical protein
MGIVASLPVPTLKFGTGDRQSHLIFSKHLTQSSPVGTGALFSLNSPRLHEFPRTTGILLGLTIRLVGA